MHKIVAPEPHEVLLTSISNHQIFKDYHEYLVEDSFLLKVAKHLKPEAIYKILQLHPVYCVEIKKNITCIAGIRTLNIASQVLPLGAKIPVQVFKNIDDELIASYCYADILLTPLALSVDSGGHVLIERLLDKLGTQSVAWTDLAACSKVKLAKAYGLSRGSLYSHERKKRKSV